MCGPGYNLGESFLAQTNKFNPPNYNFNSKINGIDVKTISRKILVAPLANAVKMTNHSETLVNDIIFDMFLGNVSYTTTIRKNDAETFYIYSNLGNKTSFYGAGFNLKNLFGFDIYLSSDVGIGSNIQITPYIKYGTEVSILNGVSFSFGTISGNVTNEITVNIGFGTLAFAYAACGIVAAAPVPMARAAAGVAALVIFLIDIID